jgi:hypothetical protein
VAATQARAGRNVKEFILGKIMSKTWYLLLYQSSGEVERRSQLGGIETL